MDARPPPAARDLRLQLEPAISTRLGVRVVRRFAARVAGAEATTEVARAVELGIPPVPGMVLAFEDGSPDCTVSKVRHRVGTTAAFGVLPVEVELICTKEPMAGLEACERAGWQRVAPAPGPEGTP
ncbi:MAG: hypothetical protein HYY19_04310 [Candidatus Rokubacteria bacterium]|nr:hypothetical protein [Candidatus Rokubacteria bacterium]